ncbi:MAG: tetratricopeptide repeat protein, partial [Anaerolineae bacterium]
MANTPGPTVSTDVVTDLVARYGRQAIQLFAALAGATGVFYAIGFVIVNFNLLRLGVYETALISVGYVVPGIAFVILATLLVVAAIGAFAAWRRLLGPAPLERVLAALFGIVTLIAGWLLLGWAMGFFRDVAPGVVIWGIAFSLIAAIMAYAENLPLVKRMIVKRTDADRSPLSPIQARLKSPAFLLVSAALTFFSVLAYGLIAYDQVPPAFGGGLPSVVRFFGEDVDRLEEIRIGLEPGTTNLTERVELIAVTEDRYIVRVADQAVSFDKSFVQGIRYELPEFSFDEAFFLLKHTGEGERLLGEERFDQALSEFKLVLGRDPSYVRALHGRVRIFRRAENPDFEGALEDYRTLTQVESQHGENFYGLAQVHVLRAQSPQEIEVDNVVSALMRAKEISATLGENAQADPVFDPLRGIRAFDQAVYGSGPDAARWFRNKSQSFAESGATDEAILALRRALTYTQQYTSDPGALSPSEVAQLHIDLSRLHLRRDPLSGEAVAELDQAVKVPGLSPTEVAEGNVRLSEVILQRDPLSDAALAARQAAVDATDQKDPKYLNLLADLYRARGDSANALATYDLALRRSSADDPNRRQALIGRGAIALEAQGYL